MVKKCNILINNDAVTVINYDGVKVQIPSIHKDAKTVNVILENNKYIVVGDDYIEPNTKTVSKPRKKTVKKATEENVENVEETTENIEN